MEEQVTRGPGSEDRRDQEPTCHGKGEMTELGSLLGARPSRFRENEWMSPRRPESTQNRNRCAKAERPGMTWGTKHR